jgi:creatinine amidohydrolase
MQRENASSDRTLAMLTSPDAGESRGGVVIVPTGSVEQHGPHLPIGTDTFIACEIARRVADSTDGVLVAEPIAYGCSWHHMAFPGTVTLRVATFVAVVVDVCRSLCEQGFRPVLLNGHGGNRSPLEVALVELAESGYRCAALTYFDLIRDDARSLLTDADSATGHACALETSISLSLWPEAVRSNAITDESTPPTWPDPHMFAGKGVSIVRGFDEIDRRGIIGNPSLATAELGQKLLGAAVDRCRDAIEMIRMELK